MPNDEPMIEYLYQCGTGDGAGTYHRQFPIPSVPIAQVGIHHPEIAQSGRTNPHFLEHAYGLWNPKTSDCLRKTSPLYPKLPLLDQVTGSMTSFLYFTKVRIDLGTIGLSNWAARMKVTPTWRIGW